MLPLLTVVDGTIREDSGQNLAPRHSDFYIYDIFVYLTGKYYLLGKEVA